MPPFAQMLLNTNICVYLNTCIPTIVKHIDTNLQTQAYRNSHTHITTTRIYTHIIFHTNTCIITHICIYTYTHIYTHKETSAAFTLATALMHFLFERSFEIVRVETA